MEKGLKNNQVNYCINKLLIQKYEQENINKESAYILEYLDGKTHVDMHVTSSVYVEK